MSTRLYLAVHLCLNLFSCNSDSYSVVAIPKPKVTVETYAGSVQGTEDGQTSTPNLINQGGITVTPNGEAYVVDRNGGAIRKISKSGTVTTLFITASKDISAITSDELNILITIFSKS